MVNQNRAMHRPLYYMDFVFDSQVTHTTGGYRTSQTESTDMCDSIFVLFVCLFVSDSGPPYDLQSELIG